MNTRLADLHNRFCGSLCPRASLPGLLAGLFAITLLIASRAEAAEVWNGPMMSFTNINGSDPTLPDNQDRITPSVWITRGGRQGVFNAAVEISYTHSLSPIGTEWAFGELTNYASLSYNTWEGWFGGPPPVGGGPSSTVGRDAVLHIIPEDIYIAVQFTSWGVRNGGFSYDRSTPSTVPEPSSALMILAGLNVLVILSRHRRISQLAVVN
jgi:hypothetical protein